MYILRIGGVGTSRRRRLAEYERLNGRYLREAEGLLEKKDYPQASQMQWGATMEMIKAVAAKRGKELGNHRSLGEFVERLDKEYPGAGSLNRLPHSK